MFDKIRTTPLQSNYRSSHRRRSVKKDVVRNFAKFTGKHLCQRLFFNKVAKATLLKKRLWRRCFPVNFAKFVRTPFLQNTSGRLLLQLLFTAHSYTCTSCKHSSNIKITVKRYINVNNHKSAML